jgi:DnaJ-class molecular chaperone
VIELFRNDPKLFFLVVIAGSGVFIALALWLRARSLNQENFKAYGTEKIAKKSRPGSDSAGGVKQLPGFRPDATPREILGVAENASEQDINRAWRDMMKRYHPDQFARPGTWQWKEAQKIATRINEAKDALLKSKKS